MTMTHHVTIGVAVAVLGVLMVLGLMPSVEAQRTHQSYHLDKF